MPVIRITIKCYYFEIILINDKSSLDKASKFASIFPKRNDAIFSSLNVLHRIQIVTCNLGRYYECCKDEGNRNDASGRFLKSINGFDYTRGSKSCSERFGLGLKSVLKAEKAPTDCRRYAYVIMLGQ